MRLSRDELLNAAGLRSDQLSELEQFGLVSKKPGDNQSACALIDRPGASTVGV